MPRGIYPSYYPVLTIILEVSYLYLAVFIYLITSINSYSKGIISMSRGIYSSHHLALTVILRVSYLYLTLFIYPITSY